MEELIIKERELRENIVQEINNSGLPAFILKPIFKEIYEQLNSLEIQQYNTAKQNTDKKNAEKKKEKKEESKK